MGLGAGVGAVASAVAGTLIVATLLGLPEFDVAKSVAEATAGGGGGYRGSCQLAYAISEPRASPAAGAVVGSTYGLSIGEAADAAVSQLGDCP